MRAWDALLIGSKLSLTDPIAVRVRAARPMTAQGRADIVQEALLHVAFRNSSETYVLSLSTHLSCSADVHGRSLRRERAGWRRAAAFPPTDVQTVTLEPKPVPRSSEFVATIRSLRSTTVQPQVEGFVRQIFVTGRRSRRAPGSRWCRSIPTASRRRVQHHRVAARRARGRSRVRQAAARRGCRSCYEAGAVSRAELEQAESAHKNAEAQLNAVQSQIRENAGAAAVLPGHRARRRHRRRHPDPAGRSRDAVDGHHHHRSGGGPRGLHQRAARTRDRVCEPGSTVELLDGDGAVIASNPVTFIAPRADDAHAVGAGQGDAARSCRPACA